jgi:hypothetical protein
VLCPSAGRNWIIAHTSQLAEAAMIVSMFHQWLLLHYAVKTHEGRCSAITNITFYYRVCALALWQRVPFYQPIGGWFSNCSITTSILTTKINTLRCCKCICHPLIIWRKGYNICCTEHATIQYTFKQFCLDELKNKLCRTYSYINS